MVRQYMVMKGKEKQSKKDKKAAEVVDEDGPAFNAEGNILFGGTGVVQNVQDFKKWADNFKTGNKDNDSYWKISRYYSEVYIAEKFNELITAEALKECLSKKRAEPSAQEVKHLAELKSREEQALTDRSAWDEGKIKVKIYNIL